MKRKIFMTLLIIAIFTGMFFLAKNTPLMSDDLGHESLIFNFDDKISSLRDIVYSQTNYYLQWGGRTQSVVQFFIWQPKMYYNVANAIVFLLVLYAIFINVNPKLRKEKSIFTFILILGLVWFGVPKLCETMVWLTGSINYLWTAFLLLNFTFLFKKSLVKEEFHRKEAGVIETIALFVLSFLAGWTNENLTLAILATSALAYFFRYRRSGNFFGQDRPLTMLTGFFLGFLVLFVAPGNYVRAGLLNIVKDPNANVGQVVESGGVLFAFPKPGGNTFDKSLSFVQNFIIRLNELHINRNENSLRALKYKYVDHIGNFKNILSNSETLWVVLIIVLLILFIVKRDNTFEIIKKYYFEATIGLFSLAVLPIFPTFAIRANFSVIIYFIIFVVNLVLELLHKNRRQMKSFAKETVMGTLILIFTVLSYFTVLSNYKESEDYSNFLQPQSFQTAITLNFDPKPAGIENLLPENFERNNRVTGIINLFKSKKEKDKNKIKVDIIK